MKAEDILFTLGRPISPIYGVSMRLRRACYEKGIFRSFGVDVPVVSIGNLLMGGTGKTPHVFELSRRYAVNVQVAICSRGYKGRVGRGPRVLLDKEGIHMDAATAGDEPYMMASRFIGLQNKGECPQIPMIIVGSDRVSCARKAVEMGAELIILDDGFQHLRLKRDCDCVLFPWDVQPETLKVFPGGALREPLSCVSHAHVVLVTNSPKDLDEKGRTAWYRRFGKDTTFFSTYLPETLVPLNGGAQMDLDCLSQKRVYLFAGIARPRVFLNTVDSLGARVLGARFFRDHHMYSHGEILEIEREARRKGADLILTTEKDLVRLEHRFDKARIDALALYALRIRTEVEEGFYRHIQGILEAKNSFGREYGF